MKHKYDSSAIVESEGFDLDCYISQENQRYVKSKHKKSESFQNISKIHSIIIDRKFEEICELTDYIHENVPELCECLYDNYYSFRSYIESRAKHFNSNSELKSRIRDLERELDYFKSEVHSSHKVYQAVHKQNQDLIAYVKQLGGNMALVHLGYSDYETLDSD